MPEGIKSFVEAVSVEMHKTIVGQDKAIEGLLVSILCGGHVLMEGVPGVAKTLMVRTLSRIMDASFSRIQFTPDLMPSDVVGTSVFDMGTGKFKIKRGPIFASLVLADEINRAPAKTQSALLEVMEERQVTIEGQRMELPGLFMVCATQNPIEYEGTYPLPEAQLDRFLVKIIVEYPEPAQEVKILERYHAGFSPWDMEGSGVKTVINWEGIKAGRQEMQKIKVEPAIITYITSIIRATRESQDIVLGGSPRASISLLLTAKARAALAGREFITPDDVKDMARPVLRHRIILKPEVEIEGVSADEAVRSILNRIEVPR